MSQADTHPDIDNYTGNGSTTAFTGNFKIEDDDDIIVERGGVADTVDTEFTVSGVGGTTFTVNYVTAPASGVVVTIRRNEKKSQLSAYTANEDFPAARIQLDLDHAMRLILQLYEKVERAPQFTPRSGYRNYDFPAPENGKYIAWAAGVLANMASVDLSATTVSSFIETLIDDVNAAAARATLDAAALTVANVFTKTQSWAKGADVASASALTLGTDGNYFHVTGSVAITSIGTLGVGTIVALQFDGAPIFTHHATDLICPGGANVALKAGDVLILEEYAAGDWRVIAHSLGTTLSLPLTTAAPATPAANTFYKDTIIKAWCNWSGGASPVIDADVNVSSITDGGVGIYTFNLATAMASAEFASVAITENATGAYAEVRSDSPPTTTSVRVVTRRNDGELNDNSGSVVILGDQ